MQIITWMIITILINFDLHGKEWSVCIATGDEVGLHENTLYSMQ